MGSVGQGGADPDMYTHVDMEPTPLEAPGQLKELLSPAPVSYVEARLPGPVPKLFDGPVRIRRHVYGGYQMTSHLL